MPSQEELNYYATQTLSEIQKQVKDLYEIHHACSQKVNVSIAKLNVKSGIWYAIAAAAPGIAALALVLLAR